MPYNHCSNQGTAAPFADRSSNVKPDCGSSCGNHGRYQDLVELEDEPVEPKTAGADPEVLGWHIRDYSRICRGSVVGGVVNPAETKSLFKHFILLQFVYNYT